MAMKINPRPISAKHQSGVTTLAITMILLAILTLIILFSANVGFFEQRTTTNENRSQITEQLAEYALNLSGEYLKSQRANIINNIGAGWFSAGAAKRWQRCPVLSATPSPCDAERDAARRSQMYYYDGDPVAAGIQGLPYASVAGAVGGALTGESATSTARFTATTNVNALLCRIDYDTTDPSNPIPKCTATPANGRDIALTLIADVGIAGENSSSTIKETWSTVATPTPSAAVPLIASGLVEGLGNAQIVASPNAGGTGVGASIWSPNNVDIGNSGPSGCGGAGVGSVSTCHLGEYLKSTPRQDLLTTCAGNGPACGCPAVSASGVDFLSGHSTSVKVERYDILDADGNCGSPDITFFPDQHGGLSPKDDDSDPSDDSLFEYIFNAPNVVGEDASNVNDTCPSTQVPGQTNCAAYVLTDEYGATVLADCSTLNTSSSGIYYVTGDCDLNSTGSPTNTVIVVVDGQLKLNGNIDFYGMLFARSNNGTADVRGNGNVKIFGSLVVEGDVNTTGSIDLVYLDTSASSGPYGPIPPNARFAKVAGSWLDSRVGI